VSVGPDPAVNLAAGISAVETHAVGDHHQDLTRAAQDTTHSGAHDRGPQPTPSTAGPHPDPPPPAGTRGPNGAGPLAAGSHDAATPAQRLAPPARAADPVRAPSAWDEFQTAQPGRAELIYRTARRQLTDAGVVDVKDSIGTAYAALTAQQRARHSKAIRVRTSTYCRVVSAIVYGHQCAKHVTYQ
jgi:hypothetical protein